jgi:hypothetical protein
MLLIAGFLTGAGWYGGNNHMLGGGILLLIVWGLLWIDRCKYRVFYTINMRCIASFSQVRKSTGINPLILSLIINSGNTNDMIRPRLPFEDCQTVYPLWHNCRREFSLTNVGRQFIDQHWRSIVARMLFAPVRRILDASICRRHPLVAYLILNPPL